VIGVTGLKGKTLPRRVLVVVTRRIGDVLLATPVIRSLKAAWPDVEVDVLVFSSTAGVLAGNADICQIRAIPERPGLMQHFVFIAKLFKRYDLALSLVPGDRPTLYAFLAARRKIGLLLDTPKERWKQRFLDQWVAYDTAEKHTVLTYLSLLGLINVTPRADVVAGWRDADQQQADALLGPLQNQRYVVLHLYPKFNYKLWSDDGWRELSRWITAQNLQIVLTGSNDSDELAYINRFAQQMSAHIPAPLNLAGKLSLGATACVLSRAAAYVGPDTAVTHMAAALGVPVVTLFGPTDPVKWGPWPKGYADLDRTPWQRLVSSGDQSRGNVQLLQGHAACVPCGKEGCRRNIASYSDCLQQLPPARVISALNAALKAAPPSKNVN
jgi:heptosyltransferase-3